MKNKTIFIITILTLSFPQINFAQAPILGATSSFALFTSVGAFDNIGATNVVGDIGTNAGTLTGFPPGTITGQIHIADSVSAQAAIDVDIAYSSLSGTTCDTAIGTTLGSNQILPPHVYCIGAASILNGNLILDGQGDSNALFILKIDGAFSTSTSSNVILINSASIANVYWQINGAFALGDSSVFRGTAIVNGAISLLGNSSLTGRGLSRGGAISLSNNNVDLGFSPILISPLPIELLNFTATANNTQIELRWTTASETNNDFFTIERSVDAIQYETMMNIDAVGNSSDASYYSASDEHPHLGISYYRLKQTDFDGKFKYFAAVGITFSTNCPSSLNVYPNPIIMGDNIYINITGEEGNEMLIEVNDLLGKQCYSKMVIIESENYPFALDNYNKLNPGVYIVVVSNNKKQYRKEIIVQ